ncbi:MAG: hypothetical protein L3J51_09490 [Cocleimonas sp.]|nr:hypothetical protein [Cocleimonas sp.]
MSFSQDVLCEALKTRRLLCNDVEVAHQKTLLVVNNKNTLSDWKISLGDNLLFDLAGLQAVTKTIQSYQGHAQQLDFKLQLSSQALRDYYSHNIFLDDNKLISLPIQATKIKSINKQSAETLLIILDELSTDIQYPHALTSPDINNTPLALLMPYSCDHDLLFANQIATFSNLNHKLRTSPFSWIRAVFSRRKISLNQRISLYWKQTHCDINIHPTAVIEGSILGKGCRVGAYCVVRYSVLGDNVQLHDGAKVEYSVVDDNSWLMHDLVLYRSLVESDVFLIHGPYQFSFFQKQSAAFANIMMDYRPDNKAIRINTPNGVRDYHGRFLGALLEEKAKVFGGTLTVPGITIPEGQEITTDINNITTAKKLLENQ